MLWVQHLLSRCTVADSYAQWNGIIGLRFVDDRLLCIRARSLELYPITFPFPNPARYFVPSSLESGEPTLAPTAALLRPIAVYNFSRTNFRTLSLSAASVKELGHDAQARETTLYILGNDVLRGVYQYRVDILDLVTQAQGPKAPSELRVSLLSMYTRLDGFVVAVALGPQARRGALIERTRSSTARRVLAFTCPLTPALPSSAAAVGAPAVDEQSEEDQDDRNREDPVAVSMLDMRPLDAIDVYDIHSLDLRRKCHDQLTFSMTRSLMVGTRGHLTRGFLRGDWPYRTWDALGRRALDLTVRFMAPCRL